MRLSPGISTPSRRGIQVSGSVVSFGLTLALLVTSVLADDSDHVLPLHDSAVLADAFNRSSDFHVIACERVVGFGGQKIAPGTARSPVRFVNSATSAGR